jgi:hypothetical protein
LKHGAFTLLPFSVVEILRGRSMTVRSRRRGRSRMKHSSEEQNDTLHFSSSAYSLQCWRGNKNRNEEKMVRE